MPEWLLLVVSVAVDYNEEEIKETFYEQELQKTTQEMFRIEKIRQ